MQNDPFEWDDAKAASNIEKHGVSFETAQLAWDDPFAVSFQDTRMDYGEDRYVLLGVVDGRLLSVVYTYRETSIRIISARKPSAQERRLYHEQAREC